MTGSNVSHILWQSDSVSMTYMKNQYRFWNLSESTLWMYDQNVMKM